MEVMDADIARIQEERQKKEQELVALTLVNFDKDLYGPGSKFEGYKSSILANNYEDDAQDPVEREVARRLASYAAPKNVLADLPRGEVADEDLGFKKPQRIIDREDDYRKRCLNRVLSPSRNDAFTMGDKTPDSSTRSYVDVMREETFKRDEEETLRLISKKKQDEVERKAQEPAAGIKSVAFPPPSPASTSAGVKRQNHWDQSQEQDETKKARAFCVVASALGIPALLPFLKAVYQSKKSWQARHTGIKIIQQIAILMGCAVLPHLRSLLEIIEHERNDVNQKVSGWGCRGLI